MTNTYNTGNALGSTDPRDLLDNASNLDDGMNSALPTFTDRLGVSRDTWAGQQDSFALAQSGREAEFRAFLVASGFVSLGNYAAGLNFTTYNQYMARDGFFYRPAPSSIPFTTTGTWVGGDENLFNLFSTDDVLRQDLANNTDPAKGAALIGYAGDNLFDFLGFVALTPSRFGILSIEQGATDPVAEAAKWETMRVAAQSAKAHVIIPAGTYVLPQGVRLDADDTVWDFSPGAKLKLWDTQANGDFLVFSAPSRQRVTGLAFDANRAMQNSAIFGGDHCACIIIDPVDFLLDTTRIISSPGKGLALVSSEGGTSANTIIRGVTGGDCNDQAVLIDGNNMLGFFKKVVLEDVQIGTTSHAGVAVNDGAHDIQLNNINCDVNNSAWDAVAVRDCWDVQLNNVRGRRGLNGVGISSFVGVCRRIQLNNVVGESNNVSGVLLFAVEDVNGGNVTGYNNGYAGINVAKTGGGVRCKNVSIANPSCYDDRGGGALQDYGLIVAGCDGAAFGRGRYHGNTVRGLSINRSVSTAIDVDVIQRKSAATGSITATGSAVVTVTWDTQFEDDEYDASAEVFVATSSIALEIGHMIAKTPTAVSFLVRNTTAGALTGTLSVVASRRP